MEAEVLLGRREDDALGGLRVDLPDGDEVARADLGIGALEPVEADDVEPFVLGIGTDRAGGRGALAGHLDDVALGEGQLRHQPPRQPGEAAPRILGPHRRDLEPGRLSFVVRHLSLVPSLLSRVR